MSTSTYHLTNDVYLLHRYLGTTEIADNDLPGEEAQSLVAAIGYYSPNEPFAVLYTTSNGDPTLVAWAELEEGAESYRNLDWTIDDAVTSWLDDPRCEWLRSALVGIGARRVALPRP